MLLPIKRLFVCLACLCLPMAVQAQLDPEVRRMLQAGYNLPIQGKGPIAAYGFYYQNLPDFPQTNQTLRLAVAPVYLDSELGFRGLLGPHTDLAVSLAGGGYADSYFEVRQGQYLKSESFIGHGGEFSTSLYHLFNPGQQVPLSLIVRGSLDGVVYARDNDTDPTFVLPEDRLAAKLRTGLRWGGQEPSLTEPLAMELSVWHESQVRGEYGPYGFNGDRVVEHTSHLFWMRALMKYTTASEHLVELRLTAGDSASVDRFSAYRLGGVLPFVSEFPLSIPGYYYQELSAEKFALLNAHYSFPLTQGRNLRLTVYGSAASVDYLDGLEQPNSWNSGVGGGLSFISPSGTWMATVIYAHGFNAIRSDGDGAGQIGVLFQWDLEAKRRGKSRFFSPDIDPYRSLGGRKLFGR